MTTSAPATPSPVLPPQKRPQSGPPASHAHTAFAALDPMKLLQQYYPWLVGALVAGVVIGVGSYFLLRRFVPRWDAEVVYEALAQATDPGQPISGGTMGGQVEMESHMNTLVRVMKSDMILQKAVQERRVKETEWAKQFTDASGGLDEVEALRELRKIVDARAVADSKIMLLRVGTRARADAPAIANAISDVFLNDTQTRSNKDMRALIQQFEEVSRRLANEIQAIEQQQKTLLERNNLTSLRQESTVQQNEVHNLQPAIVRMREERTMAEQQLKRFEELFNNPGGPVIPETIRDRTEENPLVASQDQSINGIKTAIRAQKGEYGENHPEVKRLERRLAAQEQERSALLERLTREQFAATIENLRNQVGNMGASLTEAEERLRTAERQLQDITSALKQHEDLTMSYSQKLAEKAAMDGRISDMKLMTVRPTDVRLLSQATQPDSMAFPKAFPTVAVACLLTVGLVGGLIALREIREQRVRGPQDVALIPRTKVLGIVPELSLDPSSPERIELAVVERPQGVIAESIRQIRQAVCKESAGRGVRTILFVGGLPGSGASSILTNVAANAALADMRVLVIDANIRRPAVHSIFKASDAPGVADLLLGNATFAQCVQATTVHNLSIIPCGRRDKPVAERFTSAAMLNLLAEAKSAYDLVLIDAAPGVVGGDAMALASNCDAAVLVVKAFSEKRGLVARLRNQIAETNAEFLGVVVNGVQASAGGYFKRNFQVAHEYGRESAQIETTAKNDAKDKAAKDNASGTA